MHNGSSQEQPNQLQKEIPDALNPPADTEIVGAIGPVEQEGHVGLSLTLEEEKPQRDSATDVLQIGNSG